MHRALLLLLCVVLVVPGTVLAGRYEAQGADEIRYRITRTGDGLDILVLGAGVDRPEQTVFVALGRPGGGGSPLVPAGKNAEGSAVWLPFAADLLLMARSLPVGEEKTLRRWEGTSWGEREKAGNAFTIETEPAQLLLRLPAKLLGNGDRIDLAIYLKDLAVDGGWGRLYGGLDPATASGTGERTIRHYLAMEKGKSGTTFRRAGRTDPDAPKVRIYQMLPRLFGNTNETRQPNGSITDNGSGKFSDLDEKALAEIKAMGFTHVWVTGVLQQATATDYSAIGEPADDPDLLKGVAGSPYAIRDYFDVSPDYADDPSKRREEFKALIERAHAQGMKVLIDFVPNHVARSHQSTVRPELSFGADDDRDEFFDPKNNFYYLTRDAKAEGDGPPLRLPTVDGEGQPTSPTVVAVGGGDGLFEGEKDFGRVTGNNIVSWSPAQNTWYETVKLNYGYNFAEPGKDARRYPHAGKSDLPVPDTWKKMDEIIAYWQETGVDGFRADMAHMVPPEFWRWLIERSRGRQPDVYWMAEAYDTDPSGVPGGDPAVTEVTEGAVMPELLNAGFDAVYDDLTYDALKNIYDGDGTANDLDEVRPRLFFFDNALRYAENHDEVRLAAASQWGGAGLQVGRPVSALLFGLSRGPVMLYHGQEVGEPADGAEGFGRDDARTSIYDYWSMPEFVKWVNGGAFDGGRLSDEQKALRDFYRRLLAAVDQPAFRDGDFYPLNPDNLENPGYGRLDRGVSGHWLYSFLRYDPASGQRMLVVVNLHPTETLRDVRIQFPRRAMRFLGWDTVAGSQTVPVLAQDRLGDVPGEIAGITTTPAEMENPGLRINELQPLAAAYYELETPAGP
jgi:glycosidase